MGSGASMVLPQSEEGLEKDLLDVYRELEKLKQETALHDASILLNESNKMFKTHSNITSIITSRTKSQLQMILACSKKLTIHEIESLGGSTYGRFLGLLFIDRYTMDQQTLYNATNGIGMEEKAVLDVLCTATSYDILQISNCFYKNHKTKLDIRLGGKTKRGSILQAFLMRIINADRNENEEEEADQSLAEKQTAILVESSAASFDVILDILCYISRTQCELIAKYCFQRFHIKLNDMLSDKLGVVPAYALSLWILPLPSAVALVLKQHNSDIDVVVSVMSKYDKLFLRKVDAAALKDFGMCLQDVISPALALKGNFKRVVCDWANGDTIDKGFEEILDNYLMSKCNVKKLKSIDELLANYTDRQIIIKYLTFQIAAIRDKDIDNNNFKGNGEMSESMDKLIKKTKFEMHINKVMHLGHGNGAGGPFLSRNKSFVNAVSTLTTVSPKANNNYNKSIVPLDEEDAIMNSTVGKTQVNEEEEVVTEVSVPVGPDTSRECVMSKYEWDSEHKLVNDFLFLKFSQCDSEAKTPGSIASSLIPTFVDSLGLLEMGFTMEEVEGIKSWIDTDENGEICFDEAVVELSDMMLAAIENQKLEATAVAESSLVVDDENKAGGTSLIINTISEVMKVAYRWGISTEGTKKSAARTGDDGGEEEVVVLPPDLEKYLLDSFETYDFDKNGKLDEDEFFELMTVLNIGLGDADIAELKKKWTRDQELDGNGGQISWETALPGFLDTFNSMVSDRRDHWIGLVDRDSQALFWYNLRDQSSEWMPLEDQEAYRAGFHHKGAQGVQTEFFTDNFNEFCGIDPSTYVDINENDFDESNISSNDKVEQHNNIESSLPPIVTRRVLKDPSVATSWGNDITSAGDNISASALAQKYHSSLQSLEVSLLGKQAEVRKNLNDKLAKKKKKKKKDDALSLANDENGNAVKTNSEESKTTSISKSIVEDDVNEDACVAVLPSIPPSFPLASFPLSPPPRSNRMARQSSFAFSATEIKSNYQSSIQSLESTLKQKKAAMQKNLNEKLEKKKRDHRHASSST